MPDGSYNPEIVLAGSTASEMIIPSSDSDGSIAVAPAIGGQIDGNNSDTDHEQGDDVYIEDDPAPIEGQLVVSEAIVRRTRECEMYEDISDSEFFDNDLRHSLPAQQPPQPPRDLRERINQRRSHLTDGNKYAGDSMARSCEPMALPVTSTVKEHMEACLPQHSPAPGRSEHANLQVSVARSSASISSLEEPKQPSQVKVTQLDIQLAEVAARSLFSIEDPSDETVDGIAEFIARYPSVVKHGQEAVESVRSENVTLAIDLKKAKATIAAREADLAAQIKDEVAAKGVSDAMIEDQAKLISELREWRADVIQGKGMGNLGDRLSRLEDAVVAACIDKNWLRAEMRRMWESNRHREKLYQELNTAFMDPIRPPPDWMLNDQPGRERPAAQSSAPDTSAVVPADQPGPSNRRQNASAATSRRSSVDSGLASRPASGLKRQSSPKKRKEKQAAYTTPTSSSESGESASSESSSDDDRSPPTKKAGRRHRRSESKASADSGSERETERQEIKEKAKGKKRLVKKK